MLARVDKKWVRTYGQRMTKRWLDVERNKGANLHRKQVVLKDLPEASRSLLVKKHVGSAVIGIPSTESQIAAAKAYRLTRLTSQAHSTITLASLWNKSLGYVRIVDSFLGRMYKGFFRGILTAIKQPTILIKWTRIVVDVVKHEAKHYWAGFKLLGVEIRTSVKLVSRRVSGHTLTRRERKQLIRTTGDIVRVIPLSVFILVPFMEFALPFALRLFPNMLPSTFEDQFKKEETMKKQLRLRIEIAEFLQDMVLDIGKKKAGAQPTTDEKEAKELRYKDIEKFIGDIKQGLTLPENTLYKVTKLFSDDLTIDNMSNKELILLCRYMEIPSFGNDNFLRMQLRQKINNLRSDDRVIYFEGVEALNLQELKQACQERGMRATGLPRTSLQKQLKQWVELSVDKNVPLSLLILSRAFIINDFGKQEIYTAAIKEAINKMDVGTAKIALAENFSTIQGVETDSATLTEQKLEAIKMQNLLIDREKTKVVRVNRLSANTFEDKGEEMKQIDNTIERLEDLSSDSGVLSESKALGKVLRKQQELVAIDAIRKGRITRQDPVEWVKEPETVDVDKSESGMLPNAESVQVILQKRLGRFLKKLETDIEETGEKIGTRLKVLDLDRDGRISHDELTEAINKSFKEKLSNDDIEFVIKKLDIDNDGSIAVKDIHDIIQLLEERRRAESN